jgi:hypothetical protein
VNGGTTVIALEQLDTTNNNNIDRVFMETVANSDGAFSFCPVPAGTYDVVASAVDGSGHVYAASVITGVQAGDNLMNIPVVSTNAAAASLQGTVTTSTGNSATAADVASAALQPISAMINNVPTTVQITTPLALQSAATANFTTQSLASCPVNTDCSNYTLAVPAATPGVGAFTANQNQALSKAPVLGSATYTVDAQTFVPGSASPAGDCNPSEQITTPINVTPGASFPVPLLQFNGCQ